MNTNEIKRNLNEWKPNLTQQFADLIDSDLLFEEGRKDEMFAKFQSRMGHSKFRNNYRSQKTNSK